ncbi:MAG: DUF1929 domain-containing protein [Polyangiales bacterium]
MLKSSLLPISSTQTAPIATRPQIVSGNQQTAAGEIVSLKATSGIRAFNMIRLSATTHAINSDARFVPVEFETAANGTDYTLFMHDNPNVLVPGFYWIFAINANGVPSVGRTIQVVRDASTINPTPSVVDFDNSEVVTNVANTNENLQYNNHASGTGTITYTWDFGDGTVLSNTTGTVSHTYAEPGRYEISVHAIDQPGAEDSMVFVQVVSEPVTNAVGTQSSTIVFDDETNRIWSVNPDNNTVSVTATNGTKLAEVRVGNNPWSVAIRPSSQNSAASRQAWVTNKRSASITLLDAESFQVIDTIQLRAGSQPHGIVFSSDGAFAFIALEASARVIKVDTQTRDTVASVDFGSSPRHLTIDANDQSLYASRYITRSLPDEDGPSPKIFTNANGHQGGEIVVLSTSDLSVSSTIVLQYGTASASEHSGPGIPNYVGAFAISPSGTRGFIPSKQDNILAGSSRDGTLLRFDQGVRAIDSSVTIGETIDRLPRRIDHDNASIPSQSVYGPHGVHLFTVLEGNRQVAISNAITAVEIARFNVGHAPEGLAISSDGKTLAVHNFLDRSISLFDVSGVVDHGTLEPVTITTTNVVANETLSEQVLIGKRLFYDASDDRLASFDYMSCASCHNEGAHDGRTWDFTQFGEGLRNTITLEGHGGPEHGMLHWTGNFDEVQDFEGQIRAFAGGLGLMTDMLFDEGDRSQPLGAHKAGLSSDLDALAAYVHSLTTFRANPNRNEDGSFTDEAINGQKLFTEKGCDSCHSGTALTDSASGARHDIGTMYPLSGERLGGPLDGFDTPTLLGVWATAPYLHDGSAPTLTDAIAAHSSAADLASNGRNRRMSRALQSALMVHEPGLKNQDAMTFSVVAPRRIFWEVDRPDVPLLNRVANDQFNYSLHSS